MGDHTDKQREAYQMMQAEREKAARDKAGQSNADAENLVSGHWGGSGDKSGVPVPAVTEEALAHNMSIADQADIRIKDIKGQAATEVLHVNAGRPLREAIDFLAVHRIGLSLVIDANGALAGVLSERDVIRAIAEHGADALKLPIDAFMMVDVYTCSSNDRVADIAAVMSARHFRHVPIVDDGYLMGMVSASDIVKYLGTRRQG